MELFRGTHSALVSLGPSPAVGHQGCCGVLVGVGEVILLQRE